ncbi:unnamed protein product [Spirodela intermedia]|uniref:Phosphatidylinositol 4-phosphate 5-kinase n=1 Tax=Spirodela intermedia TaxID=51605 RepID=A0A7I8IZW2_SPIIN|nr:unnamed protein product [Spirodela intermedia]CAA6662590.1 unnamed protein product [Spirodela intermedia]
MSIPVALAGDVEGILSSSDIATLDTHSLHEEELPSISGNELGLRYGDFVLHNGESYVGTLLGNAPHGTGKYIWSDGCIYEGEWRMGMRHGNGKISWPSGALYEGEFSGGYMHGTGTYNGNDGTYKGRWKLSLKHGLGCQTHPNGDVFEGSWIQGAVEGPVSIPGSMEMCILGLLPGTMGTLTKVAGQMAWRMDLESIHGPKGLLHWYMDQGPEGWKGCFLSKRKQTPVAEEFYLNALRKRGLIPDLKRQNHGSRILHFSSMDAGNMKVNDTRRSGTSSSRNAPNRNPLKFNQQSSSNAFLERRWSLEVTIEKVLGRAMSFSGETTLQSDEKAVELKFPILEREYVQGVLISELQGEAIIKGHRSYDLMLSLQLGIRYTVGKITPIQRREVRASDFGPSASFWMSFPKAGSQLTPSHHAEDFKWKDYCPMVFRNLREMFKLDAADYMVSICGSAALRELSSPGKSGSVFFLSQDDRFMIKTLRKSEVQVLLRMLPNYYHHVRTHDNTLITKFFGLHRVKPSSGQKFRFVVMGNMFCTALRIHRRYDLKGSSLGRSTDKVEIDENTTLKDLDLNYCFYLEPSWRDVLLRQIEIDSQFLEMQHIMDYSLLLGVHYRAPQHLRSHGNHLQSAASDGLAIVSEEDPQDDEISNYPQGLVLIPRGNEENSVVVGPHIRGSRLRASAIGDEEVDLLLPGTARLQIQLGVNMPARAEQLPAEDESESELFHEVYDVVLYLGIIDILQEYNTGKKIEHAYKSLKFDSLSISAVDPLLYSRRFLAFIQRIFPENP